MKELPGVRGAYAAGSPLRAIGEEHFSSNSYLLVDSGECALVDTGRGVGVLQQLRRQINAEHADLRWIVLTHYHYDHAGNAQRLKQMFPAAEVVCHRGDAPFIGRPESLFDEPFTRCRLGGTMREAFRQMSRCARQYAGYRKRSLKRCSPTTVDRSLTAPTRLPVGNLWLSIVPSPGHSPGSLTVHVPQYDSVFAGDLPLWLGPGQPHPFGNYRCWMSSLRQIRELRPGLLAWGHSVPTEGTGRCLRLLDRVIDRARKIESQMLRCIDREGKTVGELVESVFRDRPFILSGRRRLLEHSLHSMLRYHEDKDDVAFSAGSDQVRWFRK